MNRTIIAAVTLALLWGIPLGAHHSLVATYDYDKESELEGAIARFLFRNPHSFVHIEAPDENGVMQTWSFEWGGAGALTRQGVNRNTLRVGDVVVITGHPSRTIDQDHRLKMNTLHRVSDGFGWGTRPGEVVD
jgi:hypothetical protein